MSPLLVAAIHLVGPGVVVPVRDLPPEPVAAFGLDESPVTNAQFLAFLQSTDRWRRSRVDPLYADDGYLAAWASDTHLGPSVRPDAAVTGVSWFAARAYCAWRGARLPTTAEWELAAGAPIGGTPPTDRWLAWLAQPQSTAIPPVGQTPANRWGVRDIVGYVWEWTEDFNGDVVDASRFCAGGALGASNTIDYPRWVRADLRASLQANYSLTNLGFRCATEAP